jgi:hypothetical protein
LIPPLFKFDGTEIEVVPVESVVGVIEIKRTLTKETYEKAVEHLEKIIKDSGIVKNDDTNILLGMKSGFGLSTPFRSNPIIGIISLSSKKAIEFLPLVQNEVLNNLDFIYSFDGILRLTGLKDEFNKVNINIDNTRREFKKLNWWSMDKLSKQETHMKIVGYLNIYLYHSSSSVDLTSFANNYWFNTKLYQKK